MMQPLGQGGQGSGVRTPLTPAVERTAGGNSTGVVPPGTARRHLHNTGLARTAQPPLLAPPASNTSNDWPQALEAPGRHLLESSRDFVSDYLIKRGNTVYAYEINVTTDLTQIQTPGVVVFDTNQDIMIQVRMPMRGLHDHTLNPFWGC
jgi:hypothetical protein